MCRGAADSSTSSTAAQLQAWTTGSEAANGTGRLRHGAAMPGETCSSASLLPPGTGLNCSPVRSKVAG